MYEYEDPYIENLQHKLTYRHILTNSPTINQNESPALHTVPQTNFSKTQLYENRVQIVEWLTKGGKQGEQVLKRRMIKACNRGYR